LEGRKEGKDLEHLNMYGIVKRECEKKKDTLETQERRNEENF
jgi:hypothetical protein